MKKPAILCKDLNIDNNSGLDNKFIAEIVTFLLSIVYFYLSS